MHIFEALDASLERLQMDDVDLYQIHRLDLEVEPEEVMSALNDLVRSGKVRYIGASSMPAWQFQRLNNVAEKNGWTKFISMQNRYNLVYREEEREMKSVENVETSACAIDPIVARDRNAHVSPCFSSAPLPSFSPYCEFAGVGLIPYSPLAGGDLTTKRALTSVAATNEAASSRADQLNRSFNNIGATGAEAIAEAIKVSRSLTSIELGGNKIDPAGILALVDGIRVSSSMTRLGVRDCQVDCRRGGAIAGAIVVSRSLTRLDLKDTLIGDDGACSA